MDELKSTPNIMAFFLKLPSVNKTSERESNPMLLPLYLYLSRPVFLVSFTDPNKQLFNVKSVNFLNVDLVRKKCIDLLLF